jgi:hypothetical protein
MKKEVAEMVEACEACQMKMRRGANDQRHTYATTSCEGYPFQRQSIDLVGPFPMSPEGYTHLLPDATLSHMVKECRKLFSAFLWSKKRDKKSRGV